MSKNNVPKVLRRVDVNLRAFYIFNSKFGKHEGTEENKILYYYPDDIQLNTKMNDIGLSEAIIAFIGNFTNEEDCKALHTQKTTQIFYQPEKGFWMVMVLNVPKEIRLKDREEIEDYRIGEVHDRVYSAVLKQSYNLYRLFNGTFYSSLPKENAADQLQQLSVKLKTFFDMYVQKLITTKLPVTQFSEITRSVQYLPLEKSLFLRAHNLMNMTRATFTNIKETLLLINDAVVCSGDVNSYDLCSLHEYIVNNVTSFKESISSNVNLNNSSTGDFQNGSFIKTEEQHIFLRFGSEEIKIYSFLIFNVSNATVVLIIDGDEHHSTEFLNDLHNFISPQLTCLARDVEQGSQVPKQASSSNLLSMNVTDNSPKYLFINEQSVKHLTNVPYISTRSKIAGNGITTNILNLIADLRCDSRDEISETSNAPNFEEVQIKTTNDFWIVKRRCNWREYFVIIFNSKSTLLEITQEAKRIFDQELKDEVFFEK